MYVGAYLRCCVVCFSLFHGAKVVSYFSSAIPKAKYFHRIFL